MPSKEQCIFYLRRFIQYNRDNVTKGMVSLIMKNIKYHLSFKKQLGKLPALPCHYWLSPDGNPFKANAFIKSKY